MGKDRLLIADQNPEALQELANMMESLGFEDVEMSTNASDAWALLQVKEYKCLIVGWEMQDMTGLALLKIVRTSDKLYELPFFLSHSAFTRGMVAMAGQTGVTGLLVTPFDSANIKKKLDSLKYIVADPSLQDSENLLKEAMRLVESKNYGTALGMLEKMLKQDENAEALYNIGYIKTAQGKFSEAISAFRKATRLDRLFAKAYEGMGRAYQKLGKPEDAEKCMIRAADIYMTKENVDDAEAVLKEIMEISPDTVNVYNSLGVLYRKKGDFKTALKNYQKALKVHPDRASIHYNIGRLYIELKDPEMAKNYFTKALKKDPDFKEAREVLEAIEVGTL